jgi:hypothetical protein
MGSLHGWLSNGMDRLSLVWGEPLSWLILLGALVYVVVRARLGRGWPRWSLAAFSVLTIWLVATAAITTYPIEVEFDPTPGDRVTMRTFIPFADSIQGFSHTRDRVMTDTEYQAAVEKLAEEMGIPPSEVNLDRVVRGTPISVMLKDTLGNLLLFLPLGVVAPAALGVTSWKKLLGIATSLSALIEASQLFLGLGSLASIDDVMYNTTGAMLGFGLARLIRFRAGIRNTFGLV